MNPGQLHERGPVAETVFFIVIAVELVWFWRRVTKLTRPPNLLEINLLVLGAALTLLNFPLEFRVLHPGLQHALVRHIGCHQAERVLCQPPRVLGHITPSLHRKGEGSKCPQEKNLDDLFCCNASLSHFAYLRKGSSSTQPIPSPKWPHGYFHVSQHRVHIHCRPLLLPPLLHNQAGALQHHLGQ